MAAAFLAFEPEDQAAAETVAVELERNGWTVRRGGFDLRQADRPQPLVQAVAEARILVAVLSPASQASDWFQREVIAGLNNGRTLIAVIAGDIPADSWFRSVVDVDRAIDIRRGLNPEASVALIDAGRMAASRSRVIAMLNIKGGVGKTVLAANLFAAAHLIDKRAVSFIDLDPQHNLTQYFLAPAERNKLRGSGQTHACRAQPDHAGAGFREALAVPLNRVKRGKRTPRFDIVAGDERLFEYTLDTRSERDKALAFTRFRLLVHALKAKSDMVVIDANPCATFLTRLAITCADHIVAPVRPEQYSLTGLNMLEHVVREIRGRPLRPERVLGPAQRRGRPHPSRSPKRRRRTHARGNRGRALLQSGAVGGRSSRIRGPFARRRPSASRSTRSTSRR